MRPLAAEFGTKGDDRLTMTMTTMTAMTAGEISDIVLDDIEGLLFLKMLSSS